MKELNKIAVIGAGSWGTALAMTVASAGCEVVLWSPLEKQIRELAETRRNSILGSQAPDLPDNIVPTTDLARCADAALMLVVVPSVAMRSMAEKLANIGLSPDTVLVSCTKGIEQGSHKLMSQVLQQYLPRNVIGCLSGPNHAEDICRGHPSATLVGFEKKEYADWVQQIITTHNFRVYSSHDVVGMQLGGTIKNVFAIGAGLCEGLQLGDNAQAALVTRGLAEMKRIGVAYGGKPETFMGLSGMGDLIVTCYSRHSRNQTLGQTLARGCTLQEAIDSVNMVAEGVPNTLSVYEMAREVNARTPLIDAVYAVLYENRLPLEVLSELMSRDPRPEDE